MKRKQNPTFTASMANVYAHIKADTEIIERLPYLLLHYCVRGQVYTLTQCIYSSPDNLRIKRSETRKSHSFRVSVAQVLQEKEDCPWEFRTGIWTNRSAIHQQTWFSHTLRSSGGSLIRLVQTPGKKASGLGVTGTAGNVSIYIYETRYRSSTSCFLTKTANWIPNTHHWSY